MLENVWHYTVFPLLVCHFQKSPVQFHCSYGNAIVVYRFSFAADRYPRIQLYSYCCGCSWIEPAVACERLTGSCPARRSPFRSAGLDRWGTRSGPYYLSNITHLPPTPGPWSNSPRRAAAFPRHLLPAVALSLPHPIKPISGRPSTSPCCTPRINVCLAPASPAE